MTLKEALCNGMVSEKLIETWKSGLPYAGEGKDLVSFVKKAAKIRSLLFFLTNLALFTVLLFPLAFTFTFWHLEQVRFFSLILLSVLVVAAVSLLTRRCLEKRYQRFYCQADERFMDDAESLRKFFPGIVCNLDDLNKDKVHSTVENHIVFIASHVLYCEAVMNDLSFPVDDRGQASRSRDEYKRDIADCLRILTKFKFVGNLDRGYYFELAKKRNEEERRVFLSGV